MANKKSSKKVYKKGPTKAQNARSSKSRFVSFLVGAITVLLIGLIIFVYSQANNYTSVLGTQTSTQTNSR